MEPPKAKPLEIVAQANALAKAGDLSAALNRLRIERTALRRVPPPYNAAHGRLALRAGNLEEAIEHLIQARDGFADRVPPVVRNALGTALYHAGRFAEAGAELSLGMQAGAVVQRYDLRVAVASYRRKHGGETVDTIFHKQRTFVNHERKMALVCIPKNASTLLAATFVMNTAREEYFASRQSIHEFYRTRTTAEEADAVRRSDYFRLTVLRDPLRRALSAYLMKFVRDKDETILPEMAQRLHAIREAQALAGLPFNPVRSISFEEFVRFLAQADDGELNPHMMPQTTTVGTDMSIFSHVGTVERLQETFELMSQVFGFVAETNEAGHMPIAPSHLVNYSECNTTADPYTALPAQLAAMWLEMPPPAAFFTSELEELLRKRYADDCAIHATAMAGR